MYQYYYFLWCLPIRFNPLTDKDGTCTFYHYSDDKAHVESNISQNNNIMYVRFKFFRPLLLVFMSGSTIFLHKEFWLNVPVAMFFGLVVYSNYCMK